MAIFKCDDVVRTHTGAPAVISECIYEGIRSETYKVDYMGKAKVLKWFVLPGAYAEEMYKKLQYMMSCERPTKALIWPEEITEAPRDFTDPEGKKSFGYVTQPFQDGYVSMARLLLDTKLTMSFTTAVDACLKLVSAFDEIHRKGYCFGNISDECIFINPDNGDVKIIDCDNLVKRGENLYTERNMRYCAPEITVGKAVPDVKSDLYSMAILIFLLVFRRHPILEFEGIRQCHGENEMLEIYGKSPKFIIEDNVPSEYSDSFVRLWEAMPKYTRDVFTRAFGGGIEADARISEAELMRCLVRLRSDVTCLFCDGSDELRGQCGGCDGDYIFTFDKGIVMPARQKSRVYRCLIGTCETEEALDPIGVVVCTSAGYALRNKTDKIMEYTYDGTETNIAQPNGLMRFGNGVEIIVHIGQTDYKFSVTKTGGEG